MLCVICSEEIGSGFGKVFPCGHAFHTTCVTKWTQTVQPATCPTCRKGLSLVQGITLYITAEADSPVRPAVDLRRFRSLEKENAELKCSVHRTREEIQMLVVALDEKNVEIANVQGLKDAEVGDLKNQLAEAQRKLTSLLVLQSYAGTEPSDDLFEGLDPEEMLQLLKLYLKENQELARKNSELSSSAEDHAVELINLRGKIEESEASIKMLKRFRGNCQGDESGFTEYVCSNCSMVSISLVTPPRNQNSSWPKRKRRRRF